MRVEVCANSLESAQNAERAGAHRIELCAELGVGGITPSAGLIRAVRNAVQIPMYVLIRPRSGSFCYSDEEFEVMKRDIAFCKDEGCSGIVSGILLSNMQLDATRTADLVQLAGSMDFTFHRAFDWVPDPLATLKELKNLGVMRILTSGQATSAVEGLPLITQLQSEFEGVVMAGGGINPNNVREFKNAGIREIHLSGSVGRASMAPPEISMNSPKHLDETTVFYSDKALLENVIRVAKA